MHDLFSTRSGVDLTPNRLASALAKLDAEGTPFLDLTLSNPTRAGFEYSDALLAPLATSRGLLYEPSALGTTEAREAVAADFARRSIHLAADRVVLTASTSEAYSVLFKLLADPGDEILVPRPSYPLFAHLARLDALVTREYDLEYHGEWSIDIASVSAAMTTRTRALLLVSPNNPTGSFVSRPELDGLVEICAPRGVAIVADEVFADYELSAGAARRAGRVLECGDVLSFSLGGLSKSVGLPQVKLAWMGVAGPAKAVERALERLELICDTYLSVSTPVQAALAELLDRGAAVRDQIAQRVAANYRMLVNRSAATPSCRVLHSDGGWYGIVQVPSIEPEEDIVLRLLAEDRVLTHPGYFFDFTREAFLVVSLLLPPATFQDGVDRLFRHFDCNLPTEP
ncbi:MAG TPA: pyridoxal phosphate-dependent aminotransferase [Vicinamibacterales bacterium]